MKPERKQQREVKIIIPMIKDPLLSDKPGKMHESDTVKRTDDVVKNGVGVA